MPRSGEKTGQTVRSRARVLGKEILPYSRVKEAEGYLVGVTGDLP